MMHVWTANFTGRAGRPEFCRASVHDGGRSPTFHQCCRKPKVFREVDGKTYGFCAIHDPVALDVKRAKRNAEWEAKWDRDAKREEHRKANLLAMEGCKRAIKLIAEGHNDPRALAIEAFSRFPPPCE